MAILPDLRAKPMGNLVPGELVRFRFRGANPLTLAIGCDVLQIPSGMALLFLEEIPELPNSRLRFFPMADANLMETALSYGTCHIVLVEPNARVATPFEAEFQTNGCLVIGSGQPTLRVEGAHDRLRHVNIMVDVNSWKAIEGMSGAAGKIAILDWQLRMLPDSRIDPQPEPVFTFRG